MQWNHVKYIWNNICTAVVDEVKCDHRSKFSNLSNWKEEAWKKSGLEACGFIAQLVEHRTGIAEVMGSNPVEALTFFRLLLSNCLNWKIYCDDHTSLSSTTAVKIWIISYIFQMGLVSRGMLWCYCFTIFVKMEEKTSKTWWVCSWTNKISRPFPIGPQIFYSPNGQKKKKNNPRPHLLTFGYY